MTKPSYRETDCLTADTRVIALLLARGLRAIRSERFERAADLLTKAQDLIDGMERSAVKVRACHLVEALAGIGFERELDHSIAAVCAVPPALGLAR